MAQGRETLLVSRIFPIFYFKIRERLPDVDNLSHRWNEELYTSHKG